MAKEEKEEKETREGKSKREEREASREEILKRILGLGNGLVKEVEAEQNPHIDIPIRGSSNTFYDEKGKRIVLGDKVAKRAMFNVAHARKFMQTLLVASYVKKDLLENDLTATLRDLYYAKKHTIAGSKEDTIDEQKESDLAIVDLEVALDSFRERLHLRAEPKGRMAGEVVIRDRVRDKIDVIDLSRMGSGGWAVPSIVEQIEFKDVGVEYVLVAEKNAIFDRLNEDGYWKKNKCLLMTTAGQAARGARRLLQRLSTELKLPVYCLSVDGEETLPLVDDNGFVRAPTMREFVDKQMAVYGATNCGYFEKSLASGSAVQVDANCAQNDGMIVNAVRHEVNEDLFEVEGESGFSVRVTPSHSLKVFDLEKFEVVSKTPQEITERDFLVSPARVPNNEELHEISLVKLLSEKKIEKVFARTRNEEQFQSASTVPENEVTEIRWGESELRFPPKITVSPDLCRLLGYYASEGHFSDCVTLTFGPHEQHYAEDAARCVKECFGVQARIEKAHHSLRVVFGGKLLELVFEKAFECGRGAENKRVPWLVLNSPAECKKEFLRGYFRGDGQLSYSKRGCRLSAVTVSRKLASDVVFLFRQLNGWPSVYQRPLKPNEKQSYVVSVSDKQTLRELRDTALDLAKGKRDEVWDYLQKPVAKLNVRKTVPIEVLRVVQESVYKTTHRGTAHLVGNYKRVSFDKLRELFSRISSKPTSALLKDRVLNALDANESVSTRQAAAKAGVKFITAFKALKKLAAKGVVEGTREKGDWRWKRIDSTPSLSEEALRRLLVAKNIVENELVLLRFKKTKRVPASSGMVYDVEVTPTHSFVTGVGGILVSNTDADPYGWYIYSTMKYGSMALAHESERLGCKEMKFLGMSISDIEHYDLRAVTIKAKEVDIKRAEEIREYDWFKTKEWQREINKFLEKKIKAEIQALSSKNLQYISKTYLPEKIKSQDFLP